MPDLKLKLKYTTLFLILINICFLSCSRTRRLQEHELLLHKVKLDNIGKLSSYDLEDLVRQNPNRKVFGRTPYLRIYNVGSSLYDSTHASARFDQKLARLQKKLIVYKNDSSKSLRLSKKIKVTEGKQSAVQKGGNWLMRVVGEPPVIYDTSLTEKTLEQFGNYMFANGYLNGQVEEVTKVRRKRVKLRYRFQPNKPFIIETNVPSVQPQELKRLVDRNIDDSYIQEGKVFKTSYFEQERERLYRLFKNNGYFHFSRKYIRFELDSTLGNNLVRVNTLIQIPVKDSLSLFKIRKVLFNTGHVGRHHKMMRNYIYDQIEYHTNNRAFVRRVLEEKVFVLPDSLYNLEKTLLSQKNLANLNLFKFINISYFENNDTTISCIIKTTPFPKNQISTELGVNVFQTLPGPYGNVSFKTRNLLNRADIFEIGFQGLIEGQTSPLSSELVYRSQELASSLSLTFPYFFSPIRLSPKSINIHPQTRISSRYSYLLRPEFRRTNITSSFKYSWQNGPHKHFSITPFELSVVNTTEKSQAFINYLDTLALNGNNLFLSFNRSIVTSFPISFVYNDYEFGKTKRSRYLRLSAESGGSLISTINSAIGNSQNTFLGLDVFQYLKGLVDFRYYLPLKKENMLASRISVGIATPTGMSTALPYEKYFFSGGSYSNRAWLPRRLGPGSYIPQINGQPDFSYSFEQPGEIKIESNIEYRFKMSGFMNGAFLLMRATFG